MPLFPRIAGPCPYRDRLDTVVAGDWCRMCHRTVVDLTDLSDDEKQRLFTGCAEETPCVRYRLPATVAAATLVIAASAAVAQPGHHHRRYAAQPVKVAPQPIFIATAGVPALPIQWEGHDPATAAKPGASADTPGPKP